MARKDMPRSDGLLFGKITKDMPFVCTSSSYLYSLPMLTFNSPILTYGKRGTTKPGVKSAHHAIIFTESRSANPPRSLSSPPRGAEYEPQLPNSPVCVELMDPRNQLDVMSRLNYAKVYTVEHNIKVCFLGRIHKDSRAEFEASYHRVQSADNYPTGQMVDNDIYGGIDEEEGILPENEIFEY